MVQIKLVYAYFFFLKVYFLKMTQCSVFAINKVMHTSKHEISLWVVNLCSHKALLKWWRPASPVGLPTDMVIRAYPLRTWCITDVLSPKYLDVKSVENRFKLKQIYIIVHYYVSTVSNSEGFFSPVYRLYTSEKVFQIYLSMNASLIKPFFQKSKFCHYLYSESYQWKVE